MDDSPVMRRILGGLVGLGLVGGAGSVIYNHHGGATVQIRDKNGHVQNVQLDFGKKSFSCPSGEQAQLEPLLIRQGRIKLTLQGVDKDLQKILKEYPGAHPNIPHAVLVRAKSEYARVKPLVKAYRAAVDQYNAKLRRDCAAS